MRLRTTTTLALALAAGLAAGCSDEEGDPLPTAAAQQLDARLAEVQRRFDFGAGACGDIQNDTKPAVSQIIRSLPANVDQDVRDALQQSFDRLFELSDQQCDEGQAQEAAPQPEPLPEAETDTTETTEAVPTEPTTPTTETAPESLPETAPDEDQAPPPDQGDQPGQGGGGGAISPKEEG